MDRHDLSDRFSYLSLQRSNARRGHGSRSRSRDEMDVSRLGDAFNRVSLRNGQCEIVFRVYDCGHNPPPDQVRARDCGRCQSAYPNRCRPQQRDVRVSGVCPMCRARERRRRGSPGNQRRRRSRSPPRDRDSGYLRRDRASSTAPSRERRGSPSRQGTRSLSHLWRRW